MGDTSLKALTDNYDTVLIEQINETAVGEIDGYLRNSTIKYNLPLVEPIDVTIRTICGDLMRYYFYSRRGAANMPDKILKLYEITLKKLDKIKTGNIALSVTSADTGETDTAEINTIQMNTPKQQFGTMFTGFNED